MQIITIPIVDPMSMSIPVGMLWPAKAATKAGTGMNLVHHHS